MPSDPTPLTPVVAPSANRYRISADIGGTFTDVVAYDEELSEYRTGKVPTTPHDLSEGVLAGIASVTAAADAVRFAVHGTTVGLNAFLERRGERVLLLTTARDPRRLPHRPRQPDADLRHPLPQADAARPPQRHPRGRRTPGLPRRRSSSRSTRTTSSAPRRRVRERRLRRHRDRVPLRVSQPRRTSCAPRRSCASELGDVPISLSHRVAREWREYERTSSTVLDAYTAPSIGRYLERLEARARRARSFAAPLHVMQSNGGDRDRGGSARDRPLQTLLSGPVGGTMGGARARRRDRRRRNLICVDMGGTSFDVSLVVDGAADGLSRDRARGLPDPHADRRTSTRSAPAAARSRYVEAGGLRVGPQSAGADARPRLLRARRHEADRHRREPAARPHRCGRTSLGGAMQLDRRAADGRSATLAAGARPRPHELAEGIDRRRQREDGAGDPDDHRRAGDRAARLRARRVRRRRADARRRSSPRSSRSSESIVPAGSRRVLGVGDAPGRSSATTSRCRSTARSRAADPDELVRDVSRRCRRRARTALQAEGVAPDRRRPPVLGRDALRGPGVHDQRAAVARAFSASERPSTSFSTRFHDAYLARYGHANREAPVEFVTLRLVALGDLGRSRRPDSQRATATASLGSHAARSASAASRRTTRIVTRSSLAPGDTFEGPAIVEEATATTVVPPGCRCEMTTVGPLVIHVGRPRS